VFKNYFKIASRNIRNNKLFSAINISELTCCILIFLFIQHKLSYDKFNAQAKNIYRLTSVTRSPNGESQLAVTLHQVRLEKRFSIKIFLSFFTLDLYLIL
jgi:putative ABC transport system permease protein